MALIKVLWKEAYRADCEGLLDNGICSGDNFPCESRSVCSRRNRKQFYKAVSIDNGKLKVGLAVLR